MAHQMVLLRECNRYTQDELQDAVAAANKQAREGNHVLVLDSRDGLVLGKVVRAWLEGDKVMAEWVDL